MSDIEQLLPEIHQEVTYVGGDAVTEAALVETLARLPADVRKFALERCVFASVGRTTVGH